MDELLENLAKQYDLDKNDIAFVKWYASLSKEKRSDVMPTLILCALNMMAESTGCESKKDN